MHPARPLGFAAAALLVLALPLAPALAQAPEPPPFFAIQDARVVVAPGNVLEKATVLVADGLIEAVGTDLDIPADAWVIDGEGKTVYAGMINALTDLGMPQPQQGGGRGGGNPFAAGANQPQIRGPEDRPATTTWKTAADELKVDEEKFANWRGAGFTAVVSSPKEGLFAGQAALINLGSGEAKESVVASPIAHRVNWSSQGGFRSFPGSLMGVISYIRQVFSDVQHYGTARALYEESPEGRNRQDYDRTLEPLHQAMESNTPFLMPAVRAQEIDRVLAIGDQFDLNLVLFGAHDGHRRAEELKAAGAAVVVSVEWPEREKDRDPESDPNFRDLAHERLAPTTPARLAEADVPFAFTSGGLSSASKTFEGVRTAVENGLSEDDALAALTVDAAGIFGLGDRLGTVEAGKIANLVVASDAPWKEDAEIFAVFVDGVRFAERKDDEEDTSPPSSNVSGTWTLTLETPRGSQDSTATLTMAEDGKVTGEVESERGGSASVEDGRMSGDELSFKVTRDMGGRSMTASYRATVTGEALEGNFSAGPMNFELEGTRTAAATESEGAGEGAGPSVSIAEIEDALRVFQGPVRELDQFAITNATIWTVSGETIENGTVVVEDGKIKSVGRNARVPSGADVFDAQGGHVIPGIIDAHSHTAMAGGTNEGTLAVTAMVGVDDIVDPDDINIYRGLAGGLTSANILHGSANPIGGRNQVVKWRWGKTGEQMKFEGAPPGIKFALGENPKRSRSFGPIPPRYPQTRMGVMDVIRQEFAAARQYLADWDGYEASKAAGGNPTPPRIDYKLQTLGEILEGERLVHSHCYRADEILQLLRLAEEFGFKIATLQHVLEGYKVADEIAAHGAGASTFSDWWGYKVEAYDAIPHNAALMTERGVLVSINSDSSEEMRHLNQEAAKTMKWGGMSEIDALKLVTLNPAIQLGIDQRVGSIEKGKDADLVIYNGNPLSVTSVVQQTFVDGDLYFDIEADRERQALIDDLKARMLGKDDDEGESDATAPTAGGATPATPQTPGSPEDASASSNSVLEAF